MNVKLVGIAPYYMKSNDNHSHDSWEVVLNLEGYGKTIVNGVEYDFYPGFICCIPPNTAHSKYSESDFKDIFIQVDSVPLYSENEIALFKDDEDKSIETLMHLALKIFHKKDKNYLTIADSINASIHQLLLSWRNEKPKNESVELFKNELIKNFTNPEFKISEAQQVTNYCSDHFRRCFKADTGETPTSYLANLRIEYAKNLLLQMNVTKMSISEIALNSGFYDSHYFSRVFKNVVGKTPQNYAK